MLYALLLTLLLVPPAEPAADAALSAHETAAMEARYLANPRPLTTEGTSGEGYFSPDARLIIYQSIRGELPFYQIYVREMDTGREWRVSTGEGRTTCGFFHPNGRKIIFASSHLDPQRQELARQERQRIDEARRNPAAARTYAWAFDPHMDIFEADLDGSNLKRLTDADGYDAEGAYSPDGSQIVFCSFRTGNGDIYVMNADGSNVRQLTDSPGYDGGPFFSPDGRRIIYRGEADKKELLQIFVMNADGSGKRQLTDNNAVNFGPYWHPDGKRVIFATSLHGHQNYELYLLDVQTRETQRVTFTPGADVLPVFSPDGEQLMWTSRRDEQGTGRAPSQLWLADWVEVGQ